MDRSYVNGILNKHVEEYLQEAAADLRITDANIHDKTIMKSSYGAKYLRYELEEEKYMKKLKQDAEDFVEAIKKKLYEAKGQAILDGSANDTLMKTKALTIARKSPEYQKIMKDIEDQEEVLRCVAEIKKLIYQMTYDITNVRGIIAMEQ